MENNGKSIIMHLHASRINVGDDAIVQAIHDSFKEHLDNKVTFFDISSLEYNYKSDPIVDYIPINKYVHPRYFIRLIKELWKTDLVICGGGELITGYIPYLGVMAIAKILGIPIAFYSIGANLRSSSGIQKLYSKFIIRLADKIILREKGSLSELEALGVDKKRVIIAADIAFTLQKEEESVVEEIFKKERLYPKRRLIGISVRSPEEDCEVWGQNQYRELAHAFDYLVETFNTDIVFVPMLNKDRARFSGLRRLPYFIDDESLSDIIRDMMSYRDNTRTLRGNYSAKQIMNIFDSVEAVIGMRLHSNILAFNCRKPFLSLSYSPKCRKLVSLLGMEDYCIDMQNLNRQLLVEKIDLLKRNYTYLKTFIERIRREWYNRADLNTQYSLQLLGKKRGGIYFILTFPLALFFFFLHVCISIITSTRIPLIDNLGKILKFGRKSYQEKPQKILYYELSSGFGGSSNTLNSLIKGLDRKRFFPVIVTNTLGTYMKPSEELRIVVTKYTYTKKTKFYKYFPIDFLITILPEAIRLYGMLKKENISLVHINNNIMIGLPAIIASRLAHIPCVCHIRETRSLIKREVIFARYAQKFILINNRSYKDYTMQLPKDKITVIHDGIDLNDFVDNSNGSLRKEYHINNKPAIGLIGRIVEGKGQKEFVLCAKEILKKKPNVKFFIIGDAKGGNISYLHEVKSIVVKNALSKSIFFTGWRNNIKTLIPDLDIVIQASTTFPEGFGLTIIEAMGFDKPVIATNIAGPSDIVVDGVTGFLVKPGDIKEMAEKIIYLLNHKEEAKRMGEAGRKRAEELFDIKKRIKDIEAIYEELLSR